MRIFGNYSRRLTVIGIDMSILLFNGFLLLGFVVATDVLVLDSSNSGHVRQVRQIMNQNSEGYVKKCRYHKAPHSLLQAWCSNMQWDEIPVNLREDIQVLDGSRNRVRELTNDTLASYKNLIYLYLDDNFITTIGEAAFVNQRYVEILNLTKNGFDDLPKNVFQLPYLNELYLAENKLTDSVFKVKVTSPLKILLLGKNKLTKVPNVDLPILEKLNLSYNAIVTVSTEDLARFCSLKELNMTGNPFQFKNNCECHTFKTWLKEHKLRYDYVNCTAYSAIQGMNCPINVKYSNRTYELQNKCSAIIQHKIETEKARSVWILVVSCVSAFLFMVFVVLFCVHKRNRRRRRKQKEQQQLAANNANTELLNSNLKADSSPSLQFMK